MGNDGSSSIKTSYFLTVIATPKEKYQKLKTEISGFFVIVKHVACMFLTENTDRNAHICQHSGPIYNIYMYIYLYKFPITRTWCTQSSQAYIHFRDCSNETQSFMMRASQFYMHDKCHHINGWENHYILTYTCRS